MIIQKKFLEASILYPDTLAMVFLNYLSSMPIQIPTAFTPKNICLPMILSGLRVHRSDIPNVIEKQNQTSQT